MDTTRIKEIAQEIEALEEELRAIVVGVKERKPSSCGVCGETGHSSRTCPKKS